MKVWCLTTRVPILMVAVRPLLLTKSGMLTDRYVFPIPVCAAVHRISICAVCFIGGVFSCLCVRVCIWELKDILLYNYLAASCFFAPQYRVLHSAQGNKQWKVNPVAAGVRSLPPLLNLFTHDIAIILPLNGRSLIISAFWDGYVFGWFVFIS